jgi:hypothetical protein
MTQHQPAASTTLAPLARRRFPGRSHLRAALAYVVSVAGGAAVWQVLGSHSGSEVFVSLTAILSRLAR